MTTEGGTIKAFQARFVRIGNVRWDRTASELTAGGKAAKLPWRAAAALNLLVEAKGGVVTREDFERLIWGGVQMDYSVVSQCIKTLRRALEAAPDGNGYIETVARVGYRLVVEVVEELPDDPPPAPSPVAPSTTTPRPRWPTALASALLITLIVAIGFFWFRAHDRRSQADLLAERGFTLLRRGTPGFGSQATAQFREALTLFPDHPAATAGMAESAARLANDSFDHALDLARRAVVADPSCSECQSVLGYILGVRMWRWQEAGHHLMRAVELNPSRATHRIYLTEWLMVQGRLQEAAANAELATRLDPANPRSWTILAAVRYFQARYRDSIREAEHSSSLDPQHPSALLWSYHSAMRLGDDENAAMNRVKTLASLSTDPSRAYNEYAAKFYPILKKSGRKALAHYWIDEVTTGKALGVHRYNRALWFAWCGEYESALAELEAGLQSRPYQMIWTAADPAFIPLRTNPRFQKVVREIGLPLIR